MSNECAGCANWITKRETVYEDGSRIVTYAAPDETAARCELLKIDTASNFGCNSFAPGEHTVVTEKTGAPWQHWKMGPCPNCQGAGSSGGACHRCAGTGNVRFYDDGYIGEEQTRKHPKEAEVAPLPDSGTVLAEVPKDNPVIHPAG